MSERIPAGQLFKNYLPPTQNWVYAQFRVLHDFFPVVMAYRASHLRDFPVERWTAVRSGSLLRQAYDAAMHGARGYYASHVALARAAQVRLLHAHFGHTGVSSVPLARKLRLPLIVSFYGVDLWRDRGRAERLRAFYQPLFEHCTFAIAEGSVAQARLVELGCPAGKARVHRLGIDLADFPERERTPQPGLRVLMAARFTEKKGFTYGVEAFCRAARDNAGLRMTVVGDAGKGAHEQQIKQRLHTLVQMHGLSNRVRFTGNLPHAQLRQLLFEHDVLLQPSVRAADGDAEGGLPVMLLEAAAAHLPAIASRHCDIPDIVVPNQSGWLVEERDINGLADALLAARDPILRHQLGCGARHLVEERFDLHKQTLDPLYHEAL